jgi:hypothetical protein
MPDIARLDDSVILWRFLRLNSFLELLTGNLVQVRADAFDDPMEGAFGFKNVRIDRQALADVSLSFSLPMLEILNGLRQRVAITCWFEFDQESYAMWRIYGRLGESVAIETTVGQLRELLRDQDNMRIERVKYEPLQDEITDLRDPFFRKTPEYNFEREVRSVRLFPHVLGGKLFNKRVSPAEFDRFINRIIVAPGNRAILHQAIQTTVAGVFNIPKMYFRGPIEASRLDRYLIE